MFAGLTVSIPFAASAAPPPRPPSIAQVPRPIVTEFARCVAKRHPRESAAYVLRTAPTWTAAGTAARRKLADSRCVPAATNHRDKRALLGRDDLDRLRPPLAEALVREDFPAFDARLIETAQPLDYGKVVEQLWPAGTCKGCNAARLKEIELARARSTAVMGPLTFAECVTRTDPASAHKMLMSETDTPEESAALRALGSAFEQCVVAGDEFKIVLVDLRTSLALSYYRLAHAPRVRTKG